MSLGPPSIGPGQGRPFQPGKVLGVHGGAQVEREVAWLVDTGAEITTVWASVGAAFNSAPAVGFTASPTTGGGGIQVVTGIGVEFSAFDHLATAQSVRAWGYVGIKSADTQSNILGMNHLAETETRVEWDASGELGALLAPGGHSPSGVSGGPLRYGYAQSSWDATKALAASILRSRAKLTDPTITYSDLGLNLRPLSFEPDSRAFHQMLGEISSEEDAAGRGLLSVLVVHKGGDQMPGEGFFELAASRGRDTSDRVQVWITEFNRVVAYWKSHPA